MDHKKPLTPAEIKKHRKAGWTYKRISEEYDVPEGQVKSMAYRAGLMQEREKPELPWEVKKEHRRTETGATLYPYRMLLIHAALKRGDKVPESQLVRYEKWIEKLRQEHAVLAYSPEDIAGGPSAGLYYIDGDPDTGDWPVHQEPIDEHELLRLIEENLNANGNGQKDKGDRRRYG